MKTKIFLAVVLAIACHIAHADQLTRLTDFGVPKSSNPTHLMDVNGTLFFFVPTDSGYRNKLWRSDGTAAGTILVKRELPRLWPTRTTSVANVNGILFFGGDDGTDLQERSRNEL